MARLQKEEGIGPPRFLLYLKLRVIFDDVRSPKKAGIVLLILLDDKSRSLRLRRLLRDCGIDMSSLRERSKYSNERRFPKLEGKDGRLFPYKLRKVKELKSPINEGRLRKSLDLSSRCLRLVNLARLDGKSVMELKDISK